jgi:hypothetical protein
MFALATEDPARPDSASRGADVGFVEQPSDCDPRAVVESELAERRRIRI